MKKKIEAEYIEKAHYYRRKFINEFNFLEKLIENYLIRHFQIIGPNAEDFANIILDRLTFQSKKESFYALMNKKVTNQGFKKTNNNSYPHGKLFKDITEIQDERNAFAHYDLMIPIDYSKICIVLAEFRDSEKRHEYTFKEFEDLILKIKNTTTEVYKLFEALPERFLH